jgi:hypothetical protein
MDGNLYSTGPFDVVCIFDPAISEECDAVRYAELRDMSALKYNSGQEPTVFTVRRLPHSVALAITSRADTEESRNALAFRASVIAVRNLHAVNGTHYAMWKPAWTSTTDASSEALTDAEMELFPMDETQDIGSVALARANLRKGRPVCFVPPQSSALALGRKQRSSRRAELNDLPSNKPSEVKAQVPSSFDSDGAQVGDATVAAA